MKINQSINKASDLNYPPPYRMSFQCTYLDKFLEPLTRGSVPGEGRGQLWACYPVAATTTLVCISSFIQLVQKSRQRRNLSITHYKEHQRSSVVCREFEPGPFDFLHTCNSFFDALKLKASYFNIYNQK